MQKTDENTKEAKTYTFFLATKESSCPFKRNNIPCDGGPWIGRITDYQTNVISYFIGCNKYQKNERWHRFIKVKPDEIDISLLQNLFAGFIPEQIKTSQCSMIVPKSCKRKKCDVVHVNNGNIDRGRIINKPCPVRFIKFIPNNITECPFIALVCIGIHNHPPPSPERTSSGVKNNLQSLIEQAIHEDDTITPRSLLSGNLIKAYFNKETLAEVHVSLNNIDKLRYLMGKAYKTLHPFGQGIMGVYHNVSNTSSDLVHYVRKIDLFTNDNQVIITCILTEQAKKLITLEWFQIDVSFKRIKGEINEFEINTYDSDHHLILSLCRVFTNIFTAEGYHRLFSSLFKIIHEVSGQPIRFQHIHQQGVGCILADLDAAQAKGLGLALHDLDHEKDWQTHLTFVFKSCLIHFERNLRNKPFDKSTKNLIRQIPNMSSKEQVYDLLQQIRDIKDEGIEDWLSYYQQLHVIASLNQYISKINPEIWRKSGTNTNNAEAAHAMVNKEGKQLSLLLAISRGKRYDERCYKTIEIHDKTGVPYTHQDKSEVKRIQRSIKRKESHTRNNNLDTNDKLPSKKRKLSSSTSKTKSKKRQEDSASENEETALPKTNNNELLKLDIEERKMTLREREIKVRAAEAEARLMEAKAEALELENQKKKYDNA